MKTICVLPKLETLAGPASFYARFTGKARERGYQITNDPLGSNVDVILVIAGSRHLFKLLLARLKGVRIVQRLDGPNWHHRHMNTGVKHFIRSEINNWLMQIIRKFLAHALIYQSQFAKEWWDDFYGLAEKPMKIVFNAIDLQEFSPDGQEFPPKDRVRMLVLEGRMGGGQEKGLENAIHFAEHLAPRLEKPLELVVVGRLDPALQEYWDKTAGIPIHWQGAVPREQVPHLDRSAHFLFSADINGSCPNTVVESLACGLPVVGFATGAIPEMLTEWSGRCAPYGSNHWKLEPPVFDQIIDDAITVIEHQDTFRKGARKRAEDVFDIELMMSQYLAILFPGQESTAKITQ
jgi:glycosyltransferase involved in cell wall biosynthesis